MFEMSGIDSISRSFQDRIDRLQENILDGLKLSGELVVRTAQNDYLRGPRPEKLDHLSGDLAGSLTVKPKDESSVSIGTNKEYAGIHEYGGVITDGWGNGVTIIMPPRPYLRPALEDNREDIVKVVTKFVMDGLK